MAGASPDLGPWDLYGVEPRTRPAAPSRARRQGGAARTLRALSLNGLLVLTSLALCLGVLELGLRLAGFQALYDTYSKPSLLWQKDPLLGWSHVPSSQDVFVGPRPWPVEFQASVAINSLGLRGPELTPVPEGGYRVLLLGDSVTAGFEVEYEETFAARLEPLLTRELGAPVQVVNAGVRGFGTDQSYLYYRQRGRDLAPDVVLLVHSTNDPRNNVTLHRMRRLHGKPAFALEADGTLTLMGHPTPDYPLCSQYRMTGAFDVERQDGRAQRRFCEVQLALFDHSALFSFAAMRIRRNPELVKSLYHVASPPAAAQAAPTPAEPVSDYPAQLTAAIIAELAETVRADGAEFVLAGRAEGIARLGDWLADTGVRAEVAWALADESSPPVTFRNDGHFNPRGHLEMAHQLAPIVLDRLELAAARRNPDAAPAATVAMLPQPQPAP